MKPTLSERERKILDFIVSYRRDNGYAPTIMEIGEATGVTSKSMVRFYLCRLERAGRIRRTQYVARSIVVLRGAP